MLCRLFGYSWLRTLLAVALFVGCSMPLGSDVTVTNVNQLQGWRTGRRYLGDRLRSNWRLRNLFGGCVLGLLLAFKPNLGCCAAFLFLTWGLNHRWRKLGEHILGLIFGLAAAILTSAKVFGSTDCWHEWIESLRELLVKTACSSSLGNYALANMIEESTGIGVSRALLVILAATGFAVVVRSRRQTVDDHARHPLHEEVLAIGLGVTVMFLSSVLVWLHYYILLVPTGQLYCLRPAVADCRRSACWFRAHGCGLAGPPQAIIGFQTDHGGRLAGNACPVAAWSNRQNSSLQFWHSRVLCAGHPRNLGVESRSGKRKLAAAAIPGELAAVS